MLAPNSRSVGSYCQGEILSDATASSLASLSKRETLLVLLDRLHDGGMPGEGYAGQPRPAVTWGTEGLWWQFAARDFSGAWLLLQGRSLGSPTPQPSPHRHEQPEGHVALVMEPGCDG